MHGFLKLYYDNVTRTTQNTPGVTIRIPGFGKSEVVEWLDPSITQSLAGAYFKDIANSLVANGYVRNFTLRGAPFDFRKAPGKQSILVSEREKKLHTKKSKFKFSINFFQVKISSGSST